MGNWQKVNGTDKLTECRCDQLTDKRTVTCELWEIILADDVFMVQENALKFISFFLFVVFSIMFWIWIWVRVEIYSFWSYLCRFQTENERLSIKFYLRRISNVCRLNLGHLSRPIRRSDRQWPPSEVVCPSCDVEVDLWCGVWNERVNANCDDDGGDYSCGVTVIISRWWKQWR